MNRNDYYDALYHHGIKGQSWGERKYQNADGSHTPLGHERYGCESPEEYRDTIKKRVPTGYSIREKPKYPLTNKPSSDSIDAKNIFGSETTKYVKRAAIIAAAIGVGYLGANYAYSAIKNKHIANDSVLKGGSKLQRMTWSNVDESVKPIIYVATNPFDKLKYQGLYGRSLYYNQHKNESGHVIKSTLNLKSDVKIAGRDTCKQVFEELKKSNKDFGDLYRDKDYLFFNYDGLMARGFGHDHEYLDKKKKIKDELYDATRKKAWDTNKIFFNEMKKRGYGGMIDLNDADHWYQSWAPTILFDNAFDNLENTSSKKMTKLDVNRQYSKIAGVTLAQDILSDNLKNYHIDTAAKITSVSGVSVALGAQVLEEIFKEDRKKNSKNQNGRKKH